MNDPGPLPPGVMGISFRDPAGYLLNVDGRIIRMVRQPAVLDFTASLSSAAAREFTETGRLIHTRIMDSSEAQHLLRRMEFAELPDREDVGIIAEHERIPFPSFPYEWPPEMLHAAGLLTLDLAEALLEEGFGLKDGSPYNVLFVGPKPIFVDALSLEKRDPSDPTWLPYAQFVRTFVLPLLVNKSFSFPLDSLLITHRDGLDPDEVYGLFGPLKKLSPRILSLVSIPSWLKEKTPGDGKIYKKQSVRDPEKARFILRSLFRQLRRTLKSLTPKAEQRSVWSGYMISGHGYSKEQLGAKEAFVETAIRETRPRKLLDIGCNTGYFSKIAARNGASVVAIDFDPAVIGSLWRQAHTENIDVLTLVVNIARPTPGTGWRNAECPPFLERARASFDAILMLALLHHLLVTERIPLNEILDLAAELTVGWVIIEFIGADDPMFRGLCRGRERLHADFNHLVFENECRRRFDIVRCTPIEASSRRLYLLRRKNSG